MLIIVSRHDASPEIWQETYVSAILRAILYSDDPTYWVDAYRKLDPITTPETEIRFLQAAEALFLKGLHHFLRFCDIILLQRSLQAGKLARTRRSRSQRLFRTI